MLDRLITFFFFLLPLQFALNPTSSMDVPVGRVLAITIIMWWLAEVLANKALRLPPFIFTSAILSFLLWASVSLLWVEDIGFAMRKLIFLFNYLPLIFVFYDRAKKFETVTVWLRALLWGAVISVAFALTIFFLQFYLPVGVIHSWLTTSFLPIFIGNNLGSTVREFSSLMVNIGGVTFLRATGIFPDPHIASFFFGMTGFLALGMFRREQRRVFLLIAGMLFLTDLLTFSRGGYFGLLLAMFVWSSLNWSFLIERWRTSLIWILALASLLLVVFGQPVFSRFLSSFNLDDASNSERMVLWRQALGSIQENPLLGAGMGNYIRTTRPTAEYRQPYYAHNLYLDVGVELGLIGLGILLVLIGSSSVRFFKKLRRQKKDSLAVACLSLLILYLCHSLFETAFYTVHIFPLLLLALALAWYDGPTYDERI